MHRVEFTPNLALKFTDWDAPERVYLFHSSTPPKGSIELPNVQMRFPETNQQVIPPRLRLRLSLSIRPGEDSDLFSLLARIDAFARSARLGERDDAYGRLGLILDLLFVLA